MAVTVDNQAYELLAGGEANDTSVRHALYLQGLHAGINAAGRGLSVTDAIEELEARHANVLCQITSSYLHKGIEAAYGPPDRFQKVER